MSTDISGYTFTNGTKVTDWITTLPVDDRERAEKVVREFISERKPLNMLQVKIKLTAHDSSTGEFEEAHPDQEPETVRNTRDSYRQTDVYNSPGPIMPTVDSPAPVASDRHQNNNKKILKLCLIFLTVILVTAIFTNPSRDTHLRVMTEQVARATAQSIGQDIDIPQDMFGDMFGLTQPDFSDDVIRSLVEEVLNSELEYHNYILWSTCSATVGYEQHTVSLGAFGMVRSLDDDITIN